MAPSAGIAGAVGSLLGEGEVENEFEFEEEGEFELEFEAEAESEDEDELEYEDESEAFVNPVRRIYRDAELMAHLSRQAADAESEEESEAFIGALIPLAARLIPRAASLIARNAPALIRGASQIVRKLRRDPQPRLIRAMPVVLQRTAQSLADQATAGRPITAGTAVHTLITMTGRVLGSPAGRQSAVRAVDHLRPIGTGAARAAARRPGWQVGPPTRAPALPPAAARAQPARRCAVPAAVAERVGPRHPLPALERADRRRWQRALPSSPPTSPVSR